MRGTALVDWERALLGYARVGNTAAVAGVLWAWFSPEEVDELVARLLVLRARSAAMQKDEEGKRGPPRERASSAGACSDARAAHSSRRAGQHTEQRALTRLDGSKATQGGTVDQQAAQVLADVEQAALAALERELARLRRALQRADPASDSESEESYELGAARTSCLDCLELWQRAREARRDLDLDLGEEPSD